MSAAPQGDVPERDHTPPEEGQIARQLRWALRPLQPLLDRPDITDIHVNRAAPDGATDVFVKRQGARERHTVRLTARELAHIGANAVVLNRHRLTERMPFSPGRLPGGERVQVVRAPALPEGEVALSIRRRAMRSTTPQDLEDAGVFDLTESSENAPPRTGTTELIAMKEAKQWRRFLEAAFAFGYSGVFAGPVNTGKSTNMGAFFHAIPKHHRVITVQDTHELDDLPLPDVLHLFYPKDQGEGGHTAENCIEAGLRMDMDEVVNGEVRDGATWALLRAGFGGHPFKTSCHASSATAAFHSLLAMVKQHPVGRAFDNQDVLAALHQLVDFVAFSEVIDGKRRITQVWFDPAAKHGMPRAVAHALQGG